MAIEEIRAKQQALLVDAHNVRNEIVDDLPAERVAELEARFDTIMGEHDKLEARGEREARLAGAMAEAETRAAARRPAQPNAEAACAAAIETANIALAPKRALVSVPSKAIIALSKAS